MAARLDLYLLEQGLAPSREKAKDLILGSNVLVNGKTITKSSFKVEDGANVAVVGQVLKYVSKGGLKLEKAIERFEISLEGKICADIGASTGGFTDCMLQNGASKVYAIDVGHSQLAQSLIDDKRVVNLEGLNFRHCTFDKVGSKFEFASVDVSFISLSLILPVLFEFLVEGATCVCLIKPQFEAGKENVKKNGVVKDISVHLNVIENVLKVAQSIGFSILDLDYSPIKGPQGNIEYLVYLKREESSFNYLNVKADFVVESSHKELD